MNAIEAAAHINPAIREDFRQALKTCLIADHRRIQLFDQLFELYWRSPDKLENVSDILRKLYESRLSQAELESMKEQAKELVREEVRTAVQEMQSEIKGPSGEPGSESEKGIVL